MANREYTLNYRSFAGTLIKNKTGETVQIPKFEVVVEPGFDRQFNMSQNDFGQMNPISFTDKGQNAQGNLRIGNGRAQANVLELIYLRDFETGMFTIPYVQTVVVGASGQTFNETDDAWEVAGATTGEEGFGMDADILNGTIYDTTTLLGAEVPRETYAVSGPVTAGSFQQGADRALRLSNTLVGCAVDIHGEYSTTALRLSEVDPGDYTLIAKAIRNEDNQVGYFEAFNWVPNGTAVHDPGAEALEIEGTFLFTGLNNCSSPYQFYQIDNTAICLS